MIDGEAARVVLGHGAGLLAPEAGPTKGSTKSFSRIFHSFLTVMSCIYQ